MSDITTHFFISRCDACGANYRMYPPYTMIKCNECYAEMQDKLSSRSALRYTLFKLFLIHEVLRVNKNT